MEEIISISDQILFIFFNFQFNILKMISSQPVVFVSFTIIVAILFQKNSIQQCEAMKMSNSKFQMKLGMIGNAIDSKKESIESRLKHMTPMQKLDYIIKASGGTQPNSAKRVAKLISSKYEEIQYQKNLRNCLAVFKSRAICEDKASFFVWARMAARKMMKNG